MTLRLHDVEVPVSEIPANVLLNQQIASMLEIPEAAIRRVNITKKSLDARRKARIVYHYQVDVDVEDEASVYQTKSSVASISEPTAPSDPLEGLPFPEINFRHKPVIIGSGPSGVFSALTLSRAGQACVVVERGEPVEQRIKTTNKLRSRGIFTPESI
jgi:uncharacterized FAD-dependent dehydrogenase